MVPSPKSKSRTRRKARSASPLPTKQEILDYIQSSSDRVGKREIARAFGVKGADRVDLKRMLRELTDAGEISGPRKRITRTGEVPPVCVIEITGRDLDGEFIAEPESWNRSEAGEPPKILVLPDKRRGGPAPGIGDRVLARIVRSQTDGAIAYEARPIKQLERERGRLLGIFQSMPGGHGIIGPIDRKHLKEWSVSEGDTGNAENGELVRFEMTKKGRYGVPRVRVLERLGDPDGQGAISLIAIQQFGLRDDFPDAVLREADALQLPSLKNREDLRDVPLVTIDPPDARDHDDAVWAAPDGDKANPEGWVVIVAIADVAWSVTPGSDLDSEALLRGNSVYFPDRVVPMLPERISADLCSLREGENRACLAVRMVFDKAGHKKSHHFIRGMMRSAAKLSYQQVQKAIDGKPDDTTGPLLDTVLRPLWGAYGALAKARNNRGPLDLDLPERKVLLNEKGQISDIVVPPRLEAHRLIEEFMIQANVAAAETLEEKRSPLIYRAHDAPSKEKLIDLAEFLATLELSLPKSGRLMPEHFNRVLAAAKDTRNSELVSEVVLRAQAQAEYTPSNLGHFGLNLRRYAHFTSPIRRYADLIVHRALIRALGLGPGGLTDGEISKLEEISESISQSEREAMAAERQTVDRLVAAYLADRVGSIFPARVSGVTRSGLFVRLPESGADGFIPASTMIEDFYRHDEASLALIGERSGKGYQLGDDVQVRLVEAIPTAGALRFEMLSDPAPVARSGRQSRKPRPSRVRGRARRSGFRQR